jgi:hypothetical protein
VPSRPPSIPPPTPSPSRRTAAPAPVPPPTPASPDGAPQPGAPADPTAASKGAPGPLAARSASLALLAFTAITILTLLAYFARVDQPWGFESFVAVLSALLGTGATALFWRQPTREHAMGGLAVMGLSVLRVGLPTQWGVASLVVLTVTVLLAVPLVQAVMVLPRS